MTSTTNRCSAATRHGTKRSKGNAREGTSHAATGTKPEGQGYVQGELALEADFDLQALTRWRARHILSLGNEPSPSPYSTARKPGYLAACLNPVYLPDPQDGQEDSADSAGTLRADPSMNAEPSANAESSAVPEPSAVAGERGAEETIGDPQKTDAGEEKSGAEKLDGVLTNEEPGELPPLFNPGLSPEDRKSVV